MEVKMERGKYEQIERIFGARFEEFEKPLSPDDQKWIWDNVPHKDSPNNSVSVLNDNGTCKNEANLELTQSKRPKEELAGTIGGCKNNIISDLKECNYKTSPRKIASLLETHFSSCGSRPGHWLYIAQHWTPRAIIGVLEYMEKREKSGWVTIDNPAAYFTKVVRHRKKRKSRRWAQEVSSDGTKNNSE